jgi:hypothetical protein
MGVTEDDNQEAQAASGSLAREKEKSAPRHSFMMKRPRQDTETMNRFSGDGDIANIEPTPSTTIMQANPLEMIAPQPSQLNISRISFLNEHRRIGVEPIDADNQQRLHWDNEMNDNQLDHFGKLMENARKPRKIDSSIACPHRRPNRSSFVSRRSSIYDTSRLEQPCQACSSGGVDANGYP